jgi:hypothetical protein
VKSASKQVKHIDLFFKKGVGVWLEKMGKQTKKEGALHTFLYMFTILFRCAERALER